MKAIFNEILNVASVSLKRGFQRAPARNPPAGAAGRRARAARSGPIVYEHAEHLGGEFEILRREQQAGAAERLRHRAGGVGEHRHVGGHRLDQRHAEPLVLAQRDVDVGPAVERGQILVRHRAR